MTRSSTVDRRRRGALVGVACVTISHGTPSRLAAATQPNQIGQLYGSVSIVPAQPVFGGRPRPESWYQR